MDWNAVSAVGQLIGAVGVVLSLIYFAIQVRLNTNALRARSLFGAPGGRRMWETVKPRLRVSFCEFVEREVLPVATPERARNFLDPLAAAPR